ncbi:MULTISPECIES: OmpA family protein [Methylosinus]|uniref:OmpA family protein n=1 Tax=Methylosinus trichosporium (strain ATCC 35070 / NCIMB 11131 / UNIQEM 75 / OB3b) TaxID=595536 RepID=A0A2D2D0H1_METT3|nr:MULTISPECIES: OmpA family protein [Methylosinus]ATQ68462.1 OmpA family protein [Methylosinus trichosporium OB3b]OBS51303.1 hypothetical protein A8B73_16540 [Methylosinus sp. 3S-1]
MRADLSLCRRAIFAAVVIFSAPGVASAQDAVYFVEALAPHPLRSLSISSGQAADKQFVEELGERGAGHPLSISEAAKLDAIVAARRQGGFKTHFARNSATLRGKDLEVARQLGKALGDEKLAGGKFLIMGHTDARGSDEANQALSERRAEAVKHLLTTEFGVAPDRLITVGYGETHLENPKRPFAAENRRVQVVNLDAYAEN